MIHVAKEPRSITLVKGLPGTGKTAFALEIATIIGKAVLVTRGCDVAGIKARFPWLDVDCLAVLDVSTWLGGDGIANTTLSERVRVLGIQLSSQDAGAAKPLVIFDEIGSFLAGLPRNAINELYPAFAEALHVTLQNPLLLITSEMRATGIEPLANMFVILHDELLEDRPMRIMEIVKIPGGKRFFKRIPFTLLGNRFTIPLEMARIDIEHAEKWIVAPDPFGSYSTGSEKFDTFYPDCFKLSSFNLLEIDPDLPLNASNFFLSAIINFLAQQRAVIMAPVTGINTILLGKNDFTLYVDAELLDNNFRVLEERTGIITECRPYIVQIESRERELFKTYMELYDTFTSKNKYSPLLAIMEYTSLDYRNDAMLRQIINHAKFVKNANVIEFAVVHSGINPEFKLQLASIATTHIRLHTIENGITLLTSYRPRSMHLFLELDSPVMPKMRILPVV